MLNGTGAGHRIDHDSNCAKYLSKFLFEGLDHFVWATKIVLSRDYDLLFLFCFVKTPSMHTMVILKATSG